MNAFIHQLGLSAEESGVSTGTQWLRGEGPLLESRSPVDGELLSVVHTAGPEQYEHVMRSAQGSFEVWRAVPAPRRGELVREFAEVLRTHKESLGQLVSYEMGKSLQEGLGEVQEMIDVCDFAQGLSRQLYGLSMQSERPSHRMYEQWHPLGITAIITAFNFPVAVWSWNAMIALVCGNVLVWKPSEKAPLCAIVCQKLLAGILGRHQLPEGISSLLTGDASLGEQLSADERVALVSATGSTRMGRSVAVRVASRLGRSLLELGGNNAIIVSEQANLELALRAAVFGAVGTAGQRCTSTRRLLVHQSVYEPFRQGLVSAYQHLRVGNPLDPEVHMGPLIDQRAVQHYLNALEHIGREGGQFLVEGGLLEGPGFESGCYVKPSVAEVKPEMKILQEETFAPILYLMSYTDLEEAIRIQNGVPQGLSSAIMTQDLREAERFLSVCGSDCGIANVNIGTSGAEIGGAFGGEKQTGGGRESGSDAWKAYMRRQTVTINYSSDLPLAQGIRFDL